MLYTLLLLNRSFNSRSLATVWSICITEPPKIPEIYFCSLLATFVVKSGANCNFCTYMYACIYTHMHIHDHALSLYHLVTYMSSQCQLTLLLLSLNKGEQRCSHTHTYIHTYTYTPMCVRTCIHVYMHILKHTSMHCPYIMLPHPTPSSSIDHHLMYHSFHLDLLILPLLSLPRFNNS